MTGDQTSSTDQTARTEAIRSHLVEIRKRLESAASTARAAETCVAEGRVDEAISILLRVEPLTYEVDRLLAAATTIKRVLNG